MIFTGSVVNAIVYAYGGVLGHSRRIVYHVIHVFGGTIVNVSSDTIGNVSSDTMVIVCILLGSLYITCIRFFSGLQMYDPATLTYQVVFWLVGYGIVFVLRPRVL